MSLFRILLYFFYFFMDQNYLTIQVYTSFTLSVKTAA